MKVRITRRKFYELGSWRNPFLIRRQTYRGWQHYLITN